jgi:hypothetical protein
MRKGIFNGDADRLEGLVLQLVQVMRQPVWSDAIRQASAGIESVLLHFACLCGLAPLREICSIPSRISRQDAKPQRKPQSKTLERLIETAPTGC